MYQTDLTLRDASGTFNPVQAAELALRGAEQLYDIQMSAARVMLQAQANTAAAFGMPDWSSSFFDLAIDQTRQMWCAGAEQVLDAAQRASDITTELQRNAGQLIESQAAQATDTLERGMQEFNDQATQNLSSLSRAMDGATQAMDQGREWAQDTAARMARPDMPLNPVGEAVQAID